MKIKLLAYIGDCSFVRRFICPKVHLSEGSPVRRFIGPKVHLSEGSSVRRFTCPEVTNNLKNKVNIFIQLFFFHYTLSGCNHTYTGRTISCLFNYSKFVKVPFFIFIRFKMVMCAFCCFK